MRRHSIPVLALLLTLPGGSGFQAAADIPHRYRAASLDGRLAQIESPADRRLWSTWAYRSGAEYDIAVSVREADGSWSEPTFLGANNQANEIQPTLAADSVGNLYLAFAVGETGRIMLSTLRSGSSTWSAPTLVSLEAERCAAPSLRVVGGRLVAAYRCSSRVGIADLPLLPPPAPVGHVGQEGPDSFPGASDSGAPLTR